MAERHKGARFEAGELARSCGGVKALGSVNDMVRKKSDRKTRPKPRNPMARELGKGLYGQRVVKKPGKRQRQQEDRLKAREQDGLED